MTLEEHARETEEEMLGVLVRAIRVHGKPDALYLDNGSTYRDELLKVMCGRLGISLPHAGPYDPQAHGEMESTGLSTSGSARSATEASAGEARRQRRSMMNPAPTEATAALDLRQEW